MSRLLGKKKKRPDDDDDSLSEDIPLPSSSRRSARPAKANRFELDGDEDQYAAPSKPKKTTKTRYSRDTIHDEDMRRCYDLLDQLMADPLAPDFNAPLDYIALGIPFYPTVIKTPMDLGSIQSMLTHETLAHPEHFAAHVRLVFDNAMQFNQEGSPIYNAAEQLLNRFNAQYDALMAEMYPADTMDLVQDHLTHEEEAEMNDKAAQADALQLQVTQVRRKIEALKKKKGEQRLKRIRLLPPREPLTYQQKEELYKKIANLEPELLPGLLVVIQASPSDGEVEIDIEKLDDQTLLKVQDFIEGTAAGKRKPQSSSAAAKPPRQRPPTGAGPQRNRSTSTTKKKSSSGASHKPPSSSSHSNPDAARYAQLTQERESKQRRIEEIRGQMQKPTSPVKFEVGRRVFINPDDAAEGFWIGEIAGSPDQGAVLVQWFELRNREAALADPTANRSYAKSPNFDRVDINAIIPGLEPQLEYESETMAYVLPDVGSVLNQIRNA